MGIHWTDPQILAFETTLKNEGYTHIWLRNDRPGEKYPLHDHPVQTSRIVISGSMDVVTAGEKRSYGPGERCTIEKGVSHEVSVGPGGCCFVMGAR